MHRNDRDLLNAGPQEPGTSRVPKGRPIPNLRVEILSDAELVAEAKRGRLAAFTRLVERHQGSLINFFFHVSWDRQESEDCAQEVFLRLFSHLDRYEPQAKFTTFLFRVARNLWIDRVRAANARARPVSLEAAGTGGDERPLQERVAGKAMTPVELLTERDRGDALRAAIARLPEEQRIVVVLGEFEGMKYQEIGAILDVPVGTVKSRMHAAMEKLKEMLLQVEA